MPVLPEPLADLIEDTAFVLTMRGWLDPDDNEIPDEVIHQLAARIAPCGGPGCVDPPGPHEIADHWIRDRQEAWERSLPVWHCDCGAGYKIVPEFGAHQFYDAADDGLLGDMVGKVRRNQHGRVTHSDSCRACGEPFAATQDRQASPQQSLF